MLALRPLVSRQEPPIFYAPSVLNVATIRAQYDVSGRRGGESLEIEVRLFYGVHTPAREGDSLKESRSRGGWLSRNEHGTLSRHYKTLPDTARRYNTLLLPMV